MQICMRHLFALTKLKYSSEKIAEEIRKKSGRSWRRVELLKLLKQIIYNSVESY